MEQVVIGLDNGGTVSKAAVFTLQGKELACASRQTPLITPRPGYTERDMEALWRANCECVREALERSGMRAQDVAGLAVCGHGKGLYTWGKDDKPAYNGIVSTDNRAWRYPEAWKREGTFRRLYPQLCQQLLPCQPAALLAWLRDNRPEVFRNIRWVFSVKDYIRFRLTGEARSELTDLSGSGLMDVRAARVDNALLEQLGLGEVCEMLPPLCRSHELCGCVTKEAAELTGLREGTPVAGGMFDIDACAIAMNITSPEELCTITGTWSINEFISPQPILGSAVAMNSLYAIPGYYLLEECSATSAGNLEWYLEHFIKPLPRPDGVGIYEYANSLAASVAAEDCDVYYLPYLYGSNAHPLAKAGFVGLTSYHSPAHMLRAIYEGVAFSHKTHIQRLLSVREAPKAVRMAGGAVNSPFWVQLFADVLNLPIETVNSVKELGALGSAMSAAVAAGLYPGYSEAAAAMVRVSPPVLPCPEKAAVYAEKYSKYTAISHALDSVWDRFTV